ncbi:MAG TPA: hypothetical protein VF841_18350 [Anaeromyxobacter sp.]
MRTRWMIVSLAVGALASRAGAIDVADGRLGVSGFGEWGYGRTWNENDYLLGTKAGSYANAQFGLTVTARPQDALVVAGQVFYGADGEVGLDWAFAEWRVDDLLRIRVGKVKNPFGLFMEVKDVGTLRPFFTLPQSIYGPTNFAAESYLGAGITGEWQAPSGWGLAYDAYGGGLQIPTFEPSMALEGGPPPYDFASVPRHDEVARDVVGGRLGLLSPFDGLVVRVTAFTGTLAPPDRGEERISCVGVSGEWATDRVQLRGEWFRAQEGSSETHLGGYAEAAWTFLPKLQLALRLDESHQHAAGVPSNLLEHREGAAGLSYWPSPNLVFKVSYHQIDGNRFAVPRMSAPDGAVARHTQLLVAGAQFSF